MKVKVFTAANIQDAMRKVKETLGVDAIILHTRKIKQGGVMGLFAKETVEIVAAVEDVYVAPKKNNQPVKNLNKDLALSYIEKSTQERDSLVKDIADIKNILRDVVQNTNRLNSNCEDISENSNNKINFLEKYLQEKGLIPTLVEYLIKNSSLTENIDLEDAKKLFAFKLADLVKTAEIEKQNVTGPVKIALIGPTGIGKTTTLAKLAAMSIFEANLNVGLLTADTYRIAAVEQLRTYANILNIPLEVVYNLKDIGLAVQGFQDKDIIYIDTAGRSQYNKQQISELKQALQENTDITPCLVISANITFKEAVQIINNFSVNNLENVIFTKLDETFDTSIIFNVAYTYPNLKVAYITNGQNVPEDITVIDSLILARNFLKD
ncbi:flagellar biosynthesis protein FlhF [Succinispira mobilis]|uniref:flagellar biosynthesis protein FlhF n=1 Tax=Succinispira mobilis TaxID=78120 RepID=UPI00036E730A|nr:flagellar biosynthesis protein FlhF [Succinispira mobilis]